MDLKKDIGKRIADFIDRQRWSKAEFARRVKIYPQDVNKYLSGEFDFNNILAPLLENGIDLRWLLTGETPEYIAALKKGVVNEIDVEYEGRNIERTYQYPIVNLIGAGSVVPFDSGVESYLTIEYKHDNCVGLKVKGDSMANMIEDGDVVLVDLKAEVKEGDIAAVRLKRDGEQFIKKIMVLNRAEKTIFLIALNNNYKPTVLHFRDIEAIKKIVRVVKNTDY